MEDITVHNITMHARAPEPDERVLELWFTDTITGAQLVLPLQQEGAGNYIVRSFFRVFRDAAEWRRVLDEMRHAAMGFRCNRCGGPDIAATVLEMWHEYRHALHERDLSNERGDEEVHGEVGCH